MLTQQLSINYGKSQKLVYKIDVIVREGKYILKDEEIESLIATKKRLLKEIKHFEEMIHEHSIFGIII
jgi:hypothetical protein